MADIFISYANEDREAASRFAQLFESVGWRVWWDRRIPAGRTWRSILEDALREMRCLVVLWSKNSVESSWVTEEAEEARRLGKTIVPVLIERVEPPIGFRAIQAADLTAWNGSSDDPAAQLFIADLKSVLGETAERSAPSNVVPNEPITRSHALRVPTVGGRGLQIAAVVIAVGALLGGWQLWQHFAHENPTPAPEPKTENRPAPYLTNLDIHGDRQEIRPSEKIRMALTGTYSDGKQTLVKDGVTWSSSAPEVASVSENGEVVGLKAGTAQISAKTGELTSAVWTINVRSPEPTQRADQPTNMVGLRILIGRNELFAKERLPIRVRAQYSDSTELTVTAGIEWQISDRAVAAVTSAGYLEALRPGTVEVIARSGGFSSSPVRLLVKEPHTPVQAPVQPKQGTDSGLTKSTVRDQTKTTIAAYLGRAQSLREQGNYSAALAELEKARVLDPPNETVKKEIEQTKRACHAERVLGNPISC